MKKELCPKCNAVLVLDYVGLPRHPEIDCVSQQLVLAKQEIKTLKASVLAWKDAWFSIRETIGELWWHHSAIDSDTERAYYQSVQKKPCVNHSCASCEDCDQYMSDTYDDVPRVCESKS